MLQHSVRPADGAAQTFQTVSRLFFSDVYYKFSPTSGTLAGLHQYDSLLEDYSRAGVDREVAALKNYEAKFDAVDEAKLDLSEQGLRT